MLSWIFRHRARLQVIYGCVETPILAGERFRAAPAPAVALPRASRRRARPGEVLLRANGQVEIRPLPPRVR